MPIEESGGTIRHIAVSDGGGWNVSSASSRPEGADVKTAATTSASPRWSFTTEIRRRRTSGSATSTDLGKDSSPKLRSATFCARTATDGGITIEGRLRHEARRHGRYSSWAQGAAAV